MKRSEMVSILTDLIYEHIGVYGDFAGFDTSNATKILDGLEKAGMSPPFVDQLEEDTLDLIGRKWEKE